MFRKIRKAENAIEIDKDSITHFTEFFDGINTYYVFKFNNQKVLFAPHGVLPSSKNLAEVDVYIGSAFSNADKMCVLNNKNYTFRGKDNQKLDILKLAPQIDIFFIDLNGNNVSQDLVKSQKLLKTKIYLKPSEKPPKGYEVKRGPKGGLYYESRVEIAPTEILEFKKFPTKLIQYQIPKDLYAKLLVSQSSEKQLKLVYDLWTWYKENKATLSSENQRIFNSFHRSINKKIRAKLKKDFDAHVGKPKISSTAIKIKAELKSEPHKEVKTASEAFIASIVPKGMQVKLNLEKIKEQQIEVATLTQIYECQYFSMQFTEMSNEKNMRSFLLKSENLLKDLDQREAIEIVDDMQQRIINLRSEVLKDFDWDEIYYDKIMKNRIDEKYADKIAQSIHINNMTKRKIRSKTDTEVREMIKKSIMKLSPEVLKRLEKVSIRIVDRPWGYMSTERGYINISKKFFPGRGSAYTDESTFMAGFLHELTHVYEMASDEFIRAERSIFARRTRFCNIESSKAWGNIINTYTDRWRAAYTGRVYDGGNFEITSTAMGSMASDYDIASSYAEDPEMFMFAKESMLDGKYEK